MDHEWPIATLVSCMWALGSHFFEPCSLMYSSLHGFYQIDHMLIIDPICNYIFANIVAEA